MLPVILLLLWVVAYAQSVFVVEREQGSIALIDREGKVYRIGGLGNMNHATLKFFRGYAYVVSRDGYISMIDPRAKKLVKRTKVGNSTIGFTFCSDRVVVANYSPHTVVFLSPTLEILRELRTDSRNVGIKAHKGRVIFSLMDKDEVWVVDCRSMERVKSFRDIGQMPFDALLAHGRYVVGFFKEHGVGVIDLSNFSYRKLKFHVKGSEVLFKIPHFGLWGVYGETAYIPSVGNRRIEVVNLKTFTYKGSIELPGLPVFVAVSPDGRYVAVNFSGDMEDYLTLIDRSSERVLATERLGRRLMHFRFSPSGECVYVSSYYENKLKEVSLPKLKVMREFSVPTPSGVFIGGE